MSISTKSALLGSLAILICVTACSRNPPQDTCSPSLVCASAPPNRENALAHIKRHVTYPASRAQILFACARTQAFSDGEKQWLADNLPQGSYTNADAVIGALKLQRHRWSPRGPRAQLCFRADVTSEPFTSMPLIVGSAREHGPRVNTLTAFGRELLDG